MSFDACVQELKHLQEKVPHANFTTTEYYGQQYCPESGLFMIIFERVLNIWTVQTNVEMVLNLHC